MDGVTGAVIHPDLNAIPLRTTEQPVYDQPFELQLLHQDRGPAPSTTSFAIDLAREPALTATPQPTRSSSSTVT